MDILFNNILEYLMNFISRYSYFISSYYYSNLFSKYFSVSGFIIGFIFVLLIYFSSAEEQSKAGFFKVLMIIAVINSCSILTNQLYYLIAGSNPYEGNFLYSISPDNIISGFVLTLVIVSCYKTYGGRAFLFGISTYATLIMLNFQYIGMDGVNTIILFARMIVLGFLCVIISNRRYFYTSWIWYFGFHLLVRIAVFTTPIVIQTVQTESLFEFKPYFLNLLNYLFQYKVDYIVFAIILIFGIVFEKAVVHTRRKTATA